jgi:hypothetical protein
MHFFAAQKAAYIIIMFSLFLLFSTWSVIYGLRQYQDKATDTFGRLQACIHTSVRQAFFEFKNLYG